jgi:importin-7
LAGIVNGLFPTLVSIASQMVNTPPAEAPSEIPFMLHYILKTYKTSTMVRLTPHQQSAESLVPWGRLLFQVVNLQIPAEVVPQDEESRERSEWWKAKKWAYATLGRLFHRFDYLASKLFNYCLILLFTAMATHPSCLRLSKKNMDLLLNIS